MNGRSSLRTASLEPGTLIAGKYRLDFRLAGGGMGSVWKGWDLRLDTPVAIKFMRADLANDPLARSRFEREAKAAAQIHSPHVVHMYDHGVQEGAPYLVMELLEGEDLEQRLRRERWLPLHEIVRIGSEIAKGLGRAHGIGIVHRDLKPANVFLSAPDDGLVKILDFGIAKKSGVAPVAGDSTQSGVLVGSPHYMSPEQVRGIEIEPRTDLWALGVILYRLVTAKRPFDGTDVGDLAVRICTERHVAPSALRPSLGTGIDRFFDCALAKNREARFATAADLAAAFDAEIRTIYSLSGGGEPATADEPRPGFAPAGAPAADPTAATGLVTRATSLSHPAQPPTAFAGAPPAALPMTPPSPTLPTAPGPAMPREIPTGSISSGFGVDPRTPRPLPGRALWLVGAGAALLLGATLAFVLLGGQRSEPPERGAAAAEATETSNAPAGESDPAHVSSADTAWAPSSGVSSSAASAPAASALPPTSPTARVAPAPPAPVVVDSPDTRPKPPDVPTAAPSATNSRGQLLGY